jgi:hypothetical protein
MNYIPNYPFHGIYRVPEIKGGTAVAVRKVILHNHVDLPPLVTVDAIEVCIPISNKEILLAAFYETPGRTWIDADTNELLNFTQLHFGW